MRRMKDSILRVRISRGTIALIQGGSSTLTVAMVYGVIQEREQWPGVVLAVALQIFLSAWLFSFSLALIGDRLRYRSLFGGRKELDIADIKRIEVQVGEARYRDKFRPPIRLFVKSWQASRDSSFDINMKVFDKRDMEVLLQILSLETRDFADP